MINTSRENTKNEISKKRPSTTYLTTRECINDDISLFKYKVFETSHKKRVNLLTENQKKEWNQENKFRNWKSKTTFQSLKSKKKEKDKQILENIVNLKKNERNLNNNENIFSTFKLPKEDRAIYQNRERLFYWG